MALTSDTKGTDSVAIGKGALQSQNFTTETATYNVAVGRDAGNDITTGTSNTIVGGLAGDAMTSGDNNTILGFQAAGGGTITGGQITAVGNTAGFSLSG